MEQPVIHFEVIGRAPGRLRDYYGELFGWCFDVGDATTESVSERGNYGFVHGDPEGEGNIINGGVGGGGRFAPHVLFYIAVDDVEAALRKAEALGGRREMGPEGTPGKLLVGRFTDPEGNLIGVAGEN